MTTPFASNPFQLAYSPGDGVLLTVSGGTVRRFTSSGMQDMSFGTGGETTIPKILPHTSSPSPERGLVDGSGRILVAGSSNPTTHDLVVGRLNGDGSIDASFGSGGTVTVNLKSDADNEYVHSLALQSDGKILVSGEYSKGGVVIETGALDPLTTGVRILVGETTYAGNGANIYLDVTIPPDAYDPVTKIGWTAKNGKFQYKNPNGLSGIKKVKISPDAQNPATVKVKILGKNVTLPSTLDTMVAAFLQLRGGESAQCGRWDSWQSTRSCELDSGSLNCRTQ
jgi:uncharacterized delta-60 repeat protein